MDTRPDPQEPVGKHGHLLTEFVHGAFKSASLAFEADATAENWLELKRAMWVLQYAQGRQRERSMDVLADDILKRLLFIAKGDTDVGEA